MENPVMLANGPIFYPALFEPAPPPIPGARIKFSVSMNREAGAALHSIYSSNEEFIPISSLFRVPVFFVDQAHGLRLKQDYEDRNMSFDYGLRGAPAEVAFSLHTYRWKGMDRIAANLIAVKVDTTGLEAPDWQEVLNARNAFAPLSD